MQTNSERSCPHSHENSYTSPHDSCPQITSLATGPSTHSLQNSISYLQCRSNLKPLYIHQLLIPSNRQGLLAENHIFLYFGLQSLKFCNRSLVYAAPALWNGLPKDLPQFFRPAKSPLHVNSPLLALSSATFHSPLKTEFFKLSDPDSIPVQLYIHPPSFPIATIELQTVSSATCRPIFPDFDLASKRNETKSFSVAPV